MNEVILSFSGYPVSQYYEAYRLMREEKNKKIKDVHVESAQIGGVSQRDDRDIFEALNIPYWTARMSFTTAIPFNELVLSK